MAKFIIYRWHRDNGNGVISINDNSNPEKIISIGQRNMKKQGFETGITWQLHEGDFVSAMVAATKI